MDDNILWQALKVADDDCPRADDGLARLGLPLYTRGARHLRKPPSL